MDTRTELAAVIRENRSWARRMDDGYMSVGSNTDEEIADAILASPVVAHIRAEAWDEGFDAGERDVWMHDHGEGWDGKCIQNPYRADREEQGT